MIDQTLAIFVKHPELGKVKTRLASQIGDEKALAVYQALLKITHAAALNVNAKVDIWYAGNPPSNDLWGGFSKYVQADGDLGAKMIFTIKESLKRSTKVCLIGSDCPHINADILHAAFQALDHSEVVVGPATDGGYYLIGMTRPFGFLFENINWSTNEVFSATLLKLKAHQLRYHLLPVLSDIDTREDLVKEMPNFHF